MKKFVIVSMLCALPMWSVAEVKSSSAQDYKCHIITANGESVVFYRWKLADASARVSSLVGQKRTDSDGKKYFIKEVVECVPLSQVFTAEDSQKLDQRTLR